MTFGSSLVGSAASQFYFDIIEATKDAPTRYAKTHINSNTFLLCLEQGVKSVLKLVWEPLLVKSFKRSVRSALRVKHLNTSC